MHVSIGGGFTKALKEAVETGCESFQIFAGNPRGWARGPVDEGEVTRFVSERTRLGLGPVAVHLAYLPNMASKSPELYDKSFQCLLEDFRRANRLGADFFVVHPGKGNDEESTTVSLERIANAIRQVLDQIEGSTLFLLENQAGARHEIAGKVEELGTLLHLIDQPGRMGVCFDTCHAFAAGYDLRTAEGWTELSRQIEGSMGMSSIKLLHLNDSKGELGGHLDRHEHWGEGNLGAECFRQLRRQTQWRELPGILETPVAQPGDDRRNLAFLRAIIQEES